MGMLWETTRHTNGLTHLMRKHNFHCSDVYWFVQIADVKLAIAAARLVQPNLDAPHCLVLGALGRVWNYIYADIFKWANVYNFGPFITTHKFYFSYRLVAVRLGLQNNAARVSPAGICRKRPTFNVQRHPCYPLISWYSEVYAMFCEIHLVYLMVWL